MTLTTAFKKYRLKSEIPYYLMLLPGLVVLAIYSYGPMFGFIMAFQDFSPALGFFKSPWVGLENFSYIFMSSDTFRVLWNTVFISSIKIVFFIVIPIIVSLLLNEVLFNKFKRVVQTTILLPYFISWPILGGIFLDLFSLNGPINKLVEAIGFEPVFFLGDNKWFPVILIATDTWKVFGYNTVVFLAAITSIDLSLYEAATVDGANRFRRMWHVTLPGIAPIIMVFATIALGNILNAGFDQVFTLYSPIVYQSGDIIDTNIYRLGLENMQFAPAAALGLFKSVVTFSFVSAAYYLTYKFADYRIF